MTSGQKVAGQTVFHANAGQLGGYQDASLMRVIGYGLLRNLRTDGGLHAAQQHHRRDEKAGKQATFTQASSMSGDERFSTRCCGIRRRRYSALERPLSYRRKPLRNHRCRNRSPCYSLV